MISNLSSESVEATISKSLFLQVYNESCLPKVLASNSQGIGELPYNCKAIINKCSYIFIILDKQCWLAWRFFLMTPCILRHICHVDRHDHLTLKHILSLANKTNIKSLTLPRLIRKLVACYVFGANMEKTFT